MAVENGYACVTFVLEACNATATECTANASNRTAPELACSTHACPWNATLKRAEGWERGEGLGLSWEPEAAETRSAISVRGDSEHGKHVPRRRASGEV